MFARAEAVPVSYDDWIERLLELRKARWRSNEAAHDIEEQLSDAYARRRAAYARREHGPTDEIMRRSYIERELSKLAES